MKFIVIFGTLRSPSSCVHWTCIAVVVVVVVVFSVTVLFTYFLLCMSSLSICAILLTVFHFFLPTVYVVNKQCILYTVLSDARRSAGGGAALRDVTGRGGDDVIDDVSGRCDVICTETWRRRSSADRRRVSAITSTLSTRMTSGTTPNISSSVTHDHTDHCAGPL